MFGPHMENFPQAIVPPLSHIPPTRDQEAHRQPDPASQPAGWSEDGTGSKAREDVGVRGVDMGDGLGWPTRA